MRKFYFVILGLAILLNACNSTKENISIQTEPAKPTTFGRAQATKEDSINAESYYKRGLMCYNENLLDLAILYLNISTQLNPKHAQAYNLLGLALTANDNRDQAALKFKKAIELKPDYAEAYNNLAVIYESNNPKEAIYNFGKAIEFGLKTAKIFNSRGLLYYQQESFDQAIKDFTRAIELSKSAQAYYNRALVYDKAYQDGIVITDTMASAKRDTVSLKEQIGKAKTGMSFMESYYWDLGFSSKKLFITSPTFIKHAKIDSNVILAVKKISLSRSEVKAFQAGLLFTYSPTVKTVPMALADSAIADYSKVIELDKSYAQAYYNRGNLYYRIGAYKEAMLDYNYLLDFDLSIIPDKSKFLEQAVDAYRRLVKDKLEK